MTVILLALLLRPGRGSDFLTQLSNTHALSHACPLARSLAQAMQCTLRVVTDGSQAAGTVVRLQHAEQVDANGGIVISNDLGGIQVGRQAVWFATAIGPRC
jgi:hypothetical protein